MLRSNEIYSDPAGHRTGDQLEAEPDLLLLGDGEDPWVQLHDGSYNYCLVDRKKQNILVGSAPTLARLGQAALHKVWTHADYLPHTEIWAPELHIRNGRKVLYYAADGGNNIHYQTYYLEGPADAPLDCFEHNGLLQIPDTRFAIDFSLLRINGNDYGIWSGGEGDPITQQNIYIAPLENAWTLAQRPQCISRPEYEWERSRGGPGWPYVNEGPQGLQHMRESESRILVEDSFIIYSANGSWSDEYCLGRLRYLGGDPCSIDSWQKSDEPVFSKTNKVFGPGHASFTKSPDGQEDWIVYHRAKRSNAGWDREVCVQRFYWQPDGSPDFGKPLS